MIIKISPAMLYNMTDNFSFEACEAICEFYDEVYGDNMTAAEAPYVGDLGIGFWEAEPDEINEDDEMIVCRLANGNYLVAQ